MRFRKEFSKKLFTSMVISLSLLTVNAVANASDLPYDSDSSPAYYPAVATELGGYLTQLNSYDQAFMNMDMYMLNSKSARKALKKAYKYNNKAANAVSDTINTAVYSGDQNMWTNSYANFENVPLKRGPKASNVSYGQFFGVNSDLIELGNGWDGVLGIYAGYNGSHQAFDGTSIYQNGATLGLVGMAYKNNYFAGLTVNTGANMGRVTAPDFGHDDFAVIMSGIAAKTGYNWELADGKFIIQPSYKMSYSFVNEFNHTYSDSGVSLKVKSDPLHAIQIEPGLKFIGNFENGWQPYAGISMAWNIMDKTDVTWTERSTSTSQKIDSLRVKPYIRYGIGVRKTIGEKFAGFFQMYFANGGRNGIGLGGGFSWALGKASDKTANNNYSLPEKQKTNMIVKNVK